MLRTRMVDAVDSPDDDLSSAPEASSLTSHFASVVAGAATFIVHGATSTRATPVTPFTDCMIISSLLSVRSRLRKKGVSSGMSVTEGWLAATMPTLERLRTAW